MPQFGYDYRGQVRFIVLWSGGGAWGALVEGGQNDRANGAAIPPNGSVPLMRAGLFQPLLREAVAIGVPVGRLMDRLGIPGAVEEDPLLVVPSLPIWRFAAAVERHETGPLFVLRAVMNMSFTDIESLGPLLLNCLNLKELLTRLCAAAPTQANLSHYQLRGEEDVVWIEETGPLLIRDLASGALYDVAGMIQIVRLVAGADWNPPVISLGCAVHPEIERAPELEGSRVLFSRPCTGIAIPRRLLPLPVTPLHGESAAGALDDLRLLRALPSQLLRTLPAYLPEPGRDLGKMARVLGLSTRTLQRRLTESGTSWSRLLERARFLKAQELLRTTSLKIVEITYEIGYSHTSTFSHAFRQLAGVSPSEYRRRFGNGGGDPGDGSSQSTGDDGGPWEESLEGETP